MSIRDGTLCSLRPFVFSLLLLLLFELVGAIIKIVLIARPPCVAAGGLECLQRNHSSARCRRQTDGRADGRDARRMMIIKSVAPHEMTATVTMTGILCTTKS